ncbi:hypothetical protein [Sulfurimonas sp.]|jgi:hypothetical protein|uniref:hypothetical protein n=1 Tax=Sulfurimonas sp. TaxID=2022749 RepID=UPI0025CD00A1|nr:hypothetical protein [Sulfurimonas sp.]MBT5934693.1 hypothetical protein [Sulfurimonas sp.]
MSNNIKEVIEDLMKVKLDISYLNLDKKLKEKYTKSEIEYILDSVYFIMENLNKDISSSIYQSLEYLEEYEEEN